MNTVAESDARPRTLSRARLRALALIGSFAGAVLVAVTFVHFGLDRQGAAWAAAQLLLAFLATFDVATRRVPNRITAPAAIVVVVLRAAFVPSGVAEMFAAGAIASAAFLIIAVLTRGGIGIGDVKLAGLLGLLLGRAALPGLFLGILFGGIASGAVLLARRGARGQTIAYAPYLSLGGALAILAFSAPALV